MKKLLCTLTLALVMGGCLNTENRRVQIRRDADGVSIINTATQPWWAASTAGVPDDENPWLKFVRPQEDRWYDPWGQDPLSNYGVEPLSEQLRRLGPPAQKPKAPEPALKPTLPETEDMEYF